MPYTDHFPTLSGPEVALRGRITQAVRAAVADLPAYIAFDSARWLVIITQEPLGRVAEVAAECGLEIAGVVNGQ